MEQTKQRSNRGHTISVTELMGCILIILFTLQNWLDNINGVFSYIDELPALFAIIYYLLHIKTNKGRSLTKEDRFYITFLTCFTLTALLGNILYKYQTVDLVAIDLLTNLKFFFSIYLAYHVLKKDLREYRYLLKLIRFISAVNIVLFLVDRIVNIFPGQYRYGIKSAVLYFDHSTYLAGMCAFFVATLSYYGIKKNKLYISANLILILFSLRAKAIGAVVCYVVLYIVIIKFHSKLKVWQIVALAVAGIGVAWSQIYFYFIALGGHSARSVMLFTSLKIMTDYFPIGTGFATFASHSAAVNYSPVYVLYGFREIYELSGLSNATSFFDDHFWPIIFGQTGFIGTICYIGVLFILFKKIQKVKKIDLQKYFSAMFVFLYLLISSMAEPAFNNSISIPFAMLLGCVLSESNKQNRIMRC